MGIQLSSHIVDRLNKANIYDIDDLLAITKHDLVMVRGLRMKDIEEIFSALGRRGLVMKDEKELTDESSIDDLCLSYRVNRTLNRAGIYSIGKLRSKSKKELIKIWNLGRKGIEEIFVKLNEAEQIDILENNELKKCYNDDGVDKIMENNNLSAFKRLLAEELWYDLSEKEEKIICLRYGIIDGKESTVRDIGRFLGLTKQRIYQIHNSSLRRLSNRRNPRGFMKKIAEYVDPALDIVDIFKQVADNTLDVRMTEEKVNEILSEDLPTDSYEKFNDNRIYRVEEVYRKLFVRDVSFPDGDLVVLEDEEFESDEDFLFET